MRSWLIVETSEFGVVDVGLQPKESFHEGPRFRSDRPVAHCIRCRSGERRRWL
jgi:hypothetical protein